jgi:hypothetical protein
MLKALTVISEQKTARLRMPDPKKAVIPGKIKKPVPVKPVPVKTGNGERG